MAHSENKQTQSVQSAV